MSKELNNPIIKGASKSNSQRVLVQEISSATSNLNSDINSEMFKLKGIGTILIDAASRFNLILNIAKVIKNTIEVTSRAITRNIINQIEANLQLYKNNKIEVNIPKAKARIKPKTKESNLIKALNGIS